MLRYRYGPDDHISPHDDKVLETYTKSEYQAMMAPYLGVQPSQVPLLPGHAQSRQVVFSREVACVYYLNKNWTVSRNLDCAFEPHEDFASDCLITQTRPLYCVPSSLLHRLLEYMHVWYSWILDRFPHNWQ